MVNFLQHKFKIWIMIYDIGCKRSIDKELYSHHIELHTIVHQTYCTAANSNSYYSISDYYYPK